MFSRLNPNTFFNNQRCVCSTILWSQRIHISSLRRTLSDKAPPESLYATFLHAEYCFGEKRGFLCFGVQNVEWNKQIPDELIQ